MAGGMLGKALRGLRNRGKQVDRAVSRATGSMHHPNNGLDAGQDFAKVDKKFQDARRGLEDTGTPWGMDEAVATAKRKRKGK